jgi:cation transport regulator ChaC
VTLHFAYGSNMSRALMGARCPGATALGVATLAGWRFVINPDGVGSIAPHRGGVVYGVLWRLTPRDLAAINAYESVDTALYLRRVLPVRIGRRRAPALVYLARRQGEGTPRPGYISVVVEAARDWHLPEPYIESLQRWSPSGWRGARAKDTGELG